MRKSVLIMHGGTESVIARPDRSGQADRSDWQADLICTNRGLDEEGKEEEDEEDWTALLTPSPILKARFQRECLCATNSVWVSSWRGLYFLIRVHFPPNLIRSVRVAGLWCSTGWGMEWGGAEGGVREELNLNEKCFPCQAESNVWQRRSGRC